MQRPLQGALNIFCSWKISPCSKCTAFAHFAVPAPFQLMAPRCVVLVGYSENEIGNSGAIAMAASFGQLSGLLALALQ